MGNLLNEEANGIARREGGVAERVTLSQRQLIDPLWQEKIISAIANAGKGEIERSHPWPPVGW